MLLRDVLQRPGDEAVNHHSAWGYSPEPMAKMLEDGKIEVTTYHFEGEYQTHIFDDPDQVEFYLYTEGMNSTISSGIHYDEVPVLDENGIHIDYRIDGVRVSQEQFDRAYPEEWKNADVPRAGRWEGAAQWERWK